jgi:hypothetical protein
VFSNLLKSEAFPVAEIDLSKLRENVVRNIVMAADDACARDGSFEVAGVNGLDVAVAQPIGKFFKLEDAYLGEDGIRVPVNWYLLKPLHLSVSDEIKPGVLFHGKASYGRRGLKSKKKKVHGWWCTEHGDRTSPGFLDNIAPATRIFALSKGRKNGV